MVVGMGMGRAMGIGMGGAWTRITRVMFCGSSGVTWMALADGWCLARSL